MKLLILILLTLLAHFQHFAHVSALMLPRDLNKSLLPSYDYIVVGGGIAGLVTAMRLTENHTASILCIEAGNPDKNEVTIQVPAWVGQDIGGQYDWNLLTVNQTQLDGNPRPLPQGKVLGGGSILNAMVWNRGGQDDYDVWASFGNQGWDWNGMLPYFKKSETYTPVYSEAIAEQYSINFNPDVHGFAGPIHVTYPKYFYNQSVNFFEALNMLGVPTEFDPQDGTSAGAAFCPADLDPKNMTRCDARRAYYDPFIVRPNFHVITGQHVTRVLVENFTTNAQAGVPSTGGADGTGPASAPSQPLFGPANVKTVKRQSGLPLLRITGVEFAANSSAPRQVINAKREVILAAGAIHTPQLLELSGFGDAAFLKSKGIAAAQDLPGIGNNLQDHCLVGTGYPYNNKSYANPADATNATSPSYFRDFIEYIVTKTGPWTSGPPNAIAFPPLPLISNNSASILRDAGNQDPATYLPADTPPSVLAGFIQQKNSLVERLGRINVAAYEIINNNMGSMAVSVMHPLSRGTTHINSTDPFDAPVLDPRWLSNPTDRQVLMEALLFNRMILATPPMQLLQPAQLSPWGDFNASELEGFINNGIRTEFHPSGTCAMLPLELGGVVDSHLLVYGTQNLRIVDASVLPMIPAAHLQAVIYGVAEKAADIIKADNAPHLPSLSSSSVPMASGAPR